MYYSIVWMYQHLPCICNSSIMEACAHAMDSLHVQFFGLSHRFLSLSELFKYQIHRTTICISICTCLKKSRIHILIHLNALCPAFTPFVVSVFPTPSWLHYSVQNFFDFERRFVAHGKLMLLLLSMELTLYLPYVGGLRRYRHPPGMIGGRPDMFRDPR